MSPTLELQAKRFATFFLKPLEKFISCSCLQRYCNMEYVGNEKDVLSEQGIKNLKKQ